MQVHLATQAPLNILPYNFDDILRERDNALSLDSPDDKQEKYSKIFHGWELDPIELTRKDVNCRSWKTYSNECRNEEKGASSPF